MQSQKQIAFSVTHLLSLSLALSLSLFPSFSLFLPSSSLHLSLSPHPLWFPFPWLSVSCFRMRTQLSALCCDGRSVKDILLGSEQDHWSLFFFTVYRESLGKRSIFAMQKELRVLQSFSFLEQYIKLIKFWIFSSLK